jgi:AcrR family transcriptional regulator
MNHHNLRPGSTATLIADATIRIIARDGLDAVTVRNVAREVEVAPGTVQFHARTRDELLRMALERTSDRQLERVSDLPAIRDAFRVARDTLRSLLPLDELRREEAIVFIAFSAAAPTRSALRQAHAEGVALMRRHIRHLLEFAHEVGQARNGIPIELATSSLVSAIDGLMLLAINRGLPQQRDLLEALDFAIAQVIDPDVN